MYNYLRSFVFFLVFISAANLHAQEVVKVGVVTALSGPGASYGQDIRNVLLFAQEKLASELDDREVELIFEDSSCSSKGAVNAVQKLVNIDKVSYLIGFACSGSIIASSKIIDNARVPAFVITASSPRVAKLSKYIIRTTPSDALAAIKLTEHAKQYQRVAMISEETDYCLDFAEAYSSASSGTLDRYSFANTQNDFRALITKVLWKKPEAVFINTQGEDKLYNLLKLIRQYQPDMPVMAAYLAGTDKFLKLARDLADNIVYVEVADVNKQLNSEGKSLFKEFNSETKIQSMNSVFLSGFEGYRSLAKLISSGLNNAEAVESLIAEEYHGIGGKYSFNSDGDIQGLSFALMKLVQQKRIYLD